MTVELSVFQKHLLSTGHSFLVSQLPQGLLPSTDLFDDLWALHPDEYHAIKIHGRLAKTPRWQQAYGRDYYYTGRVNRAKPVPASVRPYLTWAREVIHPNLNGALLNWYDGGRDHYIGRHRDSITGLAKGAPIVTISFGERRTFRLRRWKEPGDRVDFTADHGTVFVMPCDTNLAWWHEVPVSRKLRGRRISLTIRAFEPECQRSSEPAYSSHLVMRRVLRDGSRAYRGRFAGPPELGSPPQHLSRSP